LKTTICTGFGSTTESSLVIPAAATVGSSSPAVPGSEDEVSGHSIMCHPVCVRVCVCMCVLCMRARVCVHVCLVCVRTRVRVCSRTRKEDICDDVQQNTYT
jgi:hypothetical protein